MEQKSRSEMEKAGVEIINIDDKKPFQDAVQPVWEKYGKQHAELIKRIQDVK
jgi:TRAP-type C4-dicarboxylate transport system substrate-binding protein